MLDLLVSLAGKCRVNPTGLILQLLDPDTGQPLSYKPNQTVGFLGGREVRLVPRESKSKNDRKQEKPFEKNVEDDPIVLICMSAKGFSPSCVHRDDIIVGKSQLCQGFQRAFPCSRVSVALDGYIVVVRILK
ncbi:protein cordon-bleu [Elysia marginata]|uniref:Protein cordon-bleu n=1 Tax=Elysia marginata TaxID=1093978 RepID=A0AAV4IRE5_9GAST|nr:protein cordon-bleu [Elysia marginata]